MRNATREYAVRCFVDEWFNDNPTRNARSAIYQIHSALALRDGGVFPSAREVESQARQRFPCGFQFGAFGMGIEILIDRRTINDLRDLIILVIVIEDITVQRE